MTDLKSRERLWSCAQLAKCSSAAYLPASKCDRQGNVPGRLPGFEQ